MKKTLAVVIAVACAAFIFGRSGLSQQTNGSPTNDQPMPPTVSKLVTHMMAFDKNQDGKLTRDEITDPRLLRLFDRADANHGGVVTREELIALARDIETQEGSGGGFGPSGPGGFGGPGGPPPGGFGFGGPPQPGQILPPMLRRQLKLTPDQNRQLDALQKEVDEKLSKILTDDQRQELRKMRTRGPGRGPGGRGPGFGGPGGDEPPPAPPDERPE